MPKFRLIVALPILLATTATAEVDCTIIERLERLHTSLLKIRTVPEGWIVADHMVLLRSEVPKLNGSDVRDALYDLQDPHTSAILVYFAMNVQALKQYAITNGLSEGTRVLQSPEWLSLMDEVASTFNSLPCGQQAELHHGDADGRPLPTAELTEETSEASDYKVENLRETLTYTSLLLVLAGAAGAYLIPIWRRWRALQRRRAKRFGVALASGFRTDSQIMDAEILNLSCTGAKIRYWNRDTLAEKTSGNLLIENEMVPVVVMWANNFYAGVRFDAALPIAQVRRLARADRFDALGRRKKLA